MKHILLYSLLWAGHFAISQSNILPTGGTISGNNGNVSYSIGQIDYNFQQSNNGNLNQGIQQPYEFFVLGIENFEQNVELKIYPNPSNDFVQIYSKALLNSVKYQIMTISGVLVDEGVISNNGVIDIRRIERSAYLIKIWLHNDSIQTYKLIKQ